MVKIKKFLPIIISFLLVSSVHVFANEIEEKEEELTILEEQQIEKQLQEKDLEEEKLIEDIETLEAYNYEIISEINRIEGKISQVVEKIEIIQENLDVAGEDSEKLGSLLDKMYRKGEIGYIEILLNSNNISDLLTNIQTLKTATNQKTELVLELEEHREFIAEKEKLLEQYDRELQTYKQEKSEQQALLQRSLKAQASLGNQVEELISSREEELLKMEEQSKILEEEIKKIQEEEVERIKTERVQQEEARRAKERIAQRENNIDRNQATISVSELNAWPVPGHTRISSGYGYRIHPVLGGTRFHSGIDIPAPTGTPVVAVAPGRVIMSQYSGSYGNVVVIDHGDGLSTLYAHNSNNQVNVGQMVQKGEMIALIGSTGRSTGPHSHFEVRQNGTTRNPMDWLKND